MYESRSKIMINPLSIEMIVGALMAEEEAAEAPKADMSMSFSEQKMTINSYYAKEKLASRLVNQLVAKEVSRGEGRYYFWPLVRLIIR